LVDGVGEDALGERAGTGDVAGDEGILGGTGSQVGSSNGVAGQRGCALQHRRRGGVSRARAALLGQLHQLARQVGVG
jgi:hypothetical protein